MSDDQEKCVCVSDRLLGRCWRDSAISEGASVAAGGLGEYGSDESSDEERSGQGSESSDTDEEELRHRIRQKQDAFRRKEREMQLQQEREALEGSKRGGHQNKSVCLFVFIGHTQSKEYIISCKITFYMQRLKWFIGGNSNILAKKYSLVLFTFTSFSHTWNKA